MNKHLKRILIIVLVLALVGGGTYGGLTIYRNMNRKPVNVFQVANFAQTNVWMDQSESSGSVKMDNMQKIYLSDTQKVTEVFVTEGQTVKKGDPLIAFDTTLSKLDVEKAEIALEKQKMELENQQKVLEKLKYARITEDLEAMMNSLQAQLEQAYASMPEPEYPEIPCGEWTAESPRYIENTGAINPEKLLEEAGKDEIYVVLVDAYEGQYFGYYGLQISCERPEKKPPVVPSSEEPSGSDEPAPAPDDPETPSSDEASGDPSDPSDPSDPAESPEEEPGKEPEDPADSSSEATSEAPSESSPEEPAPEEEKPSFYVTVFTPEELQPEEPEQPEIIASIEAQMNAVSNMYENAYSREELANLKESTAKAISDLELDIRIAEVNLEKAKAEVNDGTVRANIDGEITMVLPLEEMGSTYEAVLVLSGGGGYYITGSIGEFDRENLQIGQTVTINSYMDGMMYEGTVKEIGDRPALQGGWSGGNNNVSWYPFTVFVDASAELQEGDYVGITYNANQNESDGAWYLEKFLIRSENGRNYVYKADDQGRLVKQYISTGKQLWNEYYEIRGGITMDDYVAFPYGRDVVEGAETVEAGPEALYESMY